VDAQLYNGFFSDADRAAMNIVLQTEPRNLPALDITFADKRIEKVMFNYRARNYPGTLDEVEQSAGCSIVVASLPRNFSIAMPGS
jgi:exodeoxyribonuclease-1